ncbi:hypothetical protein [Sphaerisporangium fuscum]|uniref:hypothetical protein n=1 Tax=Sphaerisporangium fuscum TaxID=2835868 RepID=UPI001BDDC543|nr:hypothetical protein [Sphaerisporangium fuscum]
MAPEHASQPTRPPAWPEAPPAWPEMPPQQPSSTSVFDPPPSRGQASRQGAPSAGPDGSAPSSFSAGPYGPQPTGPQAYSPSPTGPQQYTPSGTGPQSYTPTGSGPHSSTSPGAGPQPSTPSGAGPQSYTPSGAGPQSYTPSGTGPQSYTPSGTGPQSYTPSGTGPQSYAPNGSGREEYAPQRGGREEYAPPAAGPSGRDTGQSPYLTDATGQFFAADAGPTPAPSYIPPGTETTIRVPGGLTPEMLAQQLQGMPDAYGAASAHAAPAQTRGNARPEADPRTAPHQQSGAHAPGGASYAPGAAQPPGAGHAPGGVHGPGGAPDGGYGPGGGYAQQPGAPSHAAHSNDPDDPFYKPFVTAGQISGPKTPPPERQQELWNTVFGDNYEAIGDDGDEPTSGKRVWLLALVVSVVVALVAGLLWAFLAGPLRSTSVEKTGASSAEGGSGKGSPKASSGKSGTGTTKPQSLRKLPKYPGTASPRVGPLTDQASGITIAKLGGPWRVDTRAQHIQATYGFATRQYVAAGTDSGGTPRFAQVMTGPLAKNLAAKYSASKPDDLAPAISAVAFAARNKFFPQGNKIAKTAEQRVSAGGRPARLVAYQIMAGDSKTTVVVAAVSTGTDLPAIVYMSVPDSKKDLLPDINTIFSSIRPVAG